MPSLGADMETGTLLEWRVAPGDSVHRGDIVALVDTDKAEIEVEIFCDGVIEALLVEPGRKVPVGTPLARVRESAAEAAQLMAPGAPAARLLRCSPSPRHLAARRPHRLLRPCVRRPRASRRRRPHRLAPDCARRRSRAASRRSSASISRP